MIRGFGSVGSALLAAACLASAGCATTDQVILTSSPRLNTCESGGEPHPVVLRVYYLRSTDRFSRADFTGLWQDDAAALGDDRIGAPLERTLNPRQQLTIPLRRDDAAKTAAAIGIVANFCRPGEGCWRRTVPITGKAAEIRVHLDEGCLSID